MSEEWHDQAEFWRAAAPLLFGERRWAAAAAEVDGVVELAALPAGAKILDLCCGPGRHSLELARRGYEVTGVDRNAEYLALAREKAAAEGLSLELIEEDMRRFRRPQAFDAAINLFTSFGYFDDPATDRAILANVRHSLKADGCLVMEMMGREVLARIFRRRDWVEEGGIILMEERTVTDDWTRTDSRWIILEGERRLEFNMRLRLFSAESLAALLKECGFGRTAAFGDLAGAPYDHEAKRLVMVAHRSA